MSTADQHLRAAAMRRDIARRMQLAAPDEVRVVDRVLQRLELGREQYGGLDLSVSRDWRKELREELLDALVYDVADQLSTEDRDRAALTEDARVEIAEQEARREIVRWGVDQPTRVSTEPALIALDDIAGPYVDFKFNDSEVG